MILKCMSGAAVELVPVPAQVESGSGGPVFRLSGSEQILLRVTRAASLFLGEAWKICQGRKEVVVAVLDDGVEVDHPNLKHNILWNPDRNEKCDKCGRDFFIPDDNDPEHFNPRPKNFQYPYDQMVGNDIHGTPCAGLVAGAGVGARAAFGVAPKCRILPVKVFHADNLASDARVADAIRDAALHADVISCSWAGPVSDDIAMAIKDAGVLNRKGKNAGRLRCRERRRQARRILGVIARVGRRRRLH